MKSPKILLAVFFVLLCLAVIANRAPVFAAPSSAPAAQTSNALTPTIGAPVAPAEFNGDVRALPAPSALSTSASPRVLRRPTMPRAAHAATTADPVVQTAMGATAMPAPSTSFDGLTQGINYPAGYFPPDPNGDVGPNHYIQAVNIGIGIYDKSTGTQLASFTFNSFFASAFSPCNTGNMGDPIVLYDAVSGRWIIADFAWLDSVAGPFYECIAVSKSADPIAGGWWLYTYSAGATGTSGVYWMNDYPKLGIWSDGIYMSANMFTNASSSGTFAGLRLYALNREDMIGGIPMRNVYFTLPSNYNTTILPSNLRGAQPPAGAPNYFGTVVEPSTLQLWKFHVDWNTMAASTLAGPINLSVANFTMPCGAASIYACVPQLNSPEAVDALGDRLMMQLQYRNFNGTETLWMNHTVAATANVGSPTGVRWYQVCNPNGTPFIRQQSTFQPDTNYRWMGSLAVDGSGNMALGYSVSSSTMYPAIRYAGRLVTDSLGTLGQGEAALINGTGSQNGGSYRWGDYSAMTIDPTDDATFWYTNEYYGTTGTTWYTRIGSFKFPTSSSSLTPLPLGPFVYYFPIIGKTAPAICN